MDQPAPGFPRDPRVAAARKGAWRDAVLGDRQYSATAKTVLVAILDYMSGETGWAWPSEPTLAARVGKSERTVRGSVASLKAGGAILVHAGGGRRRGKEDGRANLYTIDWPRKYEETRQVLAGISRAPASDRKYRQLPAGIPATPGPKCRQEPAAYIPSENPTDAAHCARERATGDDGAAAAVAAARPADQQVGQHVVHREPAPVNDAAAPSASPLDWDEERLLIIDSARAELRAAGGDPEQLSFDLDDDDLDRALDLASSWQRRLSDEPRMLDGMPPASTQSWSELAGALSMICTNRRWSAVELGVATMASVREIEDLLAGRAAPRAENAGRLRRFVEGCQRRNAA